MATIKIFTENNISALQQIVSAYQILNNIPAPPNSQIQFDSLLKGTDSDGTPQIEYTLVVIF